MFNAADGYFSLSIFISYHFRISAKRWRLFAVLIAGLDMKHTCLVHYILTQILHLYTVSFQIEKSRSITANKYRLSVDSSKLSIYWSDQLPQR